MPDSPKVTLAVWRDASTDPPREGEWRLTDRGWLRYTDLYEGYEDPSSPGTPLWCEEGCGEYLWVSPQPTVWCDPKPPVESAFTVDDLRGGLRRADAVLLAFSDGHDPRDMNPEAISDARRIVAFLRAALDAVSAETEEA